MTLPAWYPSSQRECWEQWLNYRLPHWDAAERQIASTLTGTQSATFRVGWNADRGGPEDRHATLFTLKHETPDTEATLAVAQSQSPISHVLHHELTEHPSPEAETPTDPRISDLVALVERAFAATNAVVRLKQDSRCPSSTLDRLGEEADQLRELARRDVEKAIVDGLLAREGMLLVPPMVLKPEMLLDRLTYELLLHNRGTLLNPTGGSLPWSPPGIAVCDGCTIVFRPRRRSTATFCEGCSKRPAQSTVFGEQPLLPGEPQTVRIPELAGSLILGWKTVTIGICPECSHPYYGRRDATMCAKCANRLRQRRHRARKKDQSL